MKRRFDRRPEDAFNEAVELLRAGESLDAFLQEHPEQAAELAPLLDTVSSVRAQRAAPARAPEVAAASRERFIAAARRASPAPRPLGFAAWWANLFGSAPGSRGFSYAMAALLVVVLLFGVSTTRVITASASALPGDTLYQIKLAGEQIQLFLARDETTREALDQTITARRIQEAAAITQLRRLVPSLAITGPLEALADAEWQIAGLKIGITLQTRISGKPAVGAHVVGRVQAPGDGRLIALELDVLPAAHGDATPMPTRTPTPTAPIPPTFTATLIPTATPSPTHQPVIVLASDTPQPQPTRTPPPSATATSPPTATRTRTPSPTVGPSPTLPRPTPQTGRKFGTVSYIEGRRWTIKEVETVWHVLTNDRTEWVHSPQLNDRVEVTYIVLDGVYVAARIEKVGGSEATPEPMDFAGLIQKLDGEWWTVRGIPFRVSERTEIDGEPAIDRFAEVHAERLAGEEIWAKRIAVKTLPEYEFTGMIEETGPGSIRVRGVTVALDSRTQYLGDPPMIGKLADVQAIQFADGRLMARTIYTWPPTPIPTVTPTRRPTRTPVPPTPDPTATATWTPLPSPSPTHTPTLEPSATPLPTETSVPTPTATSTVSAAAGTVR